VTLMVGRELFGAPIFPAKDRQKKPGDGSILDVKDLRVFGRADRRELSARGGAARDPGLSRGLVGSGRTELMEDALRREASATLAA